MKTMISIKMDAGLKKEVQKTAEAMGIPVGTIANILFRKFVREKEINVSLDYKPTLALQKAIRDAEAEYKTGKLKPRRGTAALFKALSI